jgi:hypothetical protein
MAGKISRTDERFRPEYRRIFPPFSEEVALARSDSFGSIELGRALRRQNDNTRHNLGETPGFGYHAEICMTRALTILAVVCAMVLSLSASDKAVLGSWEGDSKCTVPDSPCHDERVLYQIAEDKKDPFQLNLDGYKIVDGAPEFMGTLTCHFESKTGALSCTSSTKDKDDWEFHVVGDAMSGRLMIEGKTLYRRITLRRVLK